MLDWWGEQRKCSHCGELNPTGPKMFRKTCRKCGLSLANATPITLKGFIAFVTERDKNIIPTESRKQS